MRVHAGGAQPADLAALRSHFQFLRDDAADAAAGAADWRVRLSARYYRRLFREYALADLSLAREGRLGLRWRTAAEVVAGKGQFECGSTRCNARDSLRSYELLFAYVEQDETKRCLVKVRVCEACAALLFYRKLRERKKAEKKKRRREEEDSTNGRRAAGKKRRRAAAASDGDDDDKDEVAASDDSSSRRSTGAQQRSVHEMCAEISARDSARIRERDEEARSAGGAGYFEDRKGGSDHEAFRDLLL